MTRGQTVASGQDWVTRTGFTLTPETTKDWTWDLKQWLSRQKTPCNKRQRDGHKWGEPCNCPGTTLKEFPGLISCAGKGNPASACWTPWAEGTERPRRPTAGDPERRELNRESELWGPRRVCLEFQAGKDHLKRSGRTSPWLTQSWKR